MPPSLFLAFAVVCLLQRGAEILRHDRNVGERRPQWTAVAITAVFLGFTFGSVAEAIVMRRPPNLASAIFGGLLFSAGFIVRRWVLRALGELWAIDIDLKPGHHLVTTGPYRFCRHPNYVAMLLEMTGICLLGTAYYSLAVFFPLYFLVLLARIHREEAALIAKLGDEYREYRRRTFAFLPIRRRSPGV